MSASNWCSVLLVFTIAAGLRPLGAQSVAGASVEGMVTDSIGLPVGGAEVILRHPATGATYSTLSRADGRYRLDVVPVDGPYTLLARSIGRPPAPPQPIVLAAGDRVHRRLLLATESPLVLTELMVRAPPIPADGGQGFTIPGDGIRHLPLMNRDFAGLFAAVPQSVGRTINAIDGQHPGYNAIQLDGASGSDAYGVGRTPGSRAGAKSISLEALAGLRIRTAPFDVRQGGFAGGKIEAVTRSGTNSVAGLLFTTLQQPFLVGRDTAGAPVATFDKLQYGATLGGPIVRDRLHYFVAVDLQRSTTPFVGPEAGQPGSGISDSTARRAAAVFRASYGFDAGGVDPPLIAQPDHDVFIKLSWHPGTNRHLDVSHHRVSAATDLFNREVRNRPNRDGWQLSGSGARQTSLVQGTTLRGWFSGPRWTEEFLVGYRTIREQTASALNAPLFLVEADQPGIYLAGGSVSAAQGTILNQDLLELANDLSVTLGSHRVTLGAQAALSGFIDNLFINARGVWRFPSVDALERREPNRYEVSLPLRAGGPVADFGAQMLSAYLQDRWTPSERLAVTAGVRVDAPFIDAPLTNPVLAASAALGHLDTGDFPSGNTALSPRLGVVLDLSRTWRTVLRAGAGVFTAQPPMAWLGGAFSNTGLDQQSLICTPQDGVPPPVTNPADRPSACTGSAGQPSPPSNIVTFAPGFRFPQAEKLLIGLDHALGAGITASVDVMRTHTRHAVYLTDVNLTPGTPTSEGRAMYGSLNATGVAVTTRPEQEQFRQVARYENRSGDRSRSLTVSLRKAWERGGFVQVGGQWAHATDAFTINRISAMLTLQATPIDGTLAERRRTRSGYDVPVSLTASGAVPLGAGLTVAWLARHQSGRPYAYAVTGDANADGIASNDLFFVPSRADDISLAAADQYEVLDRFIAGEACLNRQRGRIMARNSCRNPAFTTLDTRLSWAVPFSRRPLEIDIDVFNLANLLHRRWGLVRETSAGEAKTGLVSLVGWDAANNRPRYTLATSGGAYLVPARRQVLTDLSRWRMQLGARLHF